MVSGAHPTKNHEVFRYMSQALRVDWVDVRIATETREAEAKGGL